MRQLLFIIIMVLVTFLVVGGVMYGLGTITKQFMCFRNEYCEEKGLGETIYTSDFTNDFYCVQRDDDNRITSSVYVNWSEKNKHCQEDGVSEE